MPGLEGNRGVCTLWNEPLISADYQTAFWLFILVRLLHTLKPRALLTEACRIGIFRWGFSFGCLGVSPWSPCLASVRILTVGKLQCVMARDFQPR